MCRSWVPKVASTCGYAFTSPLAELGTGRHPRAFGPGVPACRNCIFSGLSCDVMMSQVTCLPGKDKQDAGTQHEEKRTRWVRASRKMLAPRPRGRLAGEVLRFVRQRSNRSQRWSSAPRYCKILVEAPAKPGALWVGCGWVGAFERHGWLRHREPPPDKTTLSFLGGVEWSILLVCYESGLVTG